MAAEFDRNELLEALDELGRAAIEAGARLDIAVFGGAALMLASNFRFATEDVDIAEIGQPWPEWLTTVVTRIANERGWREEWLNDAVTFHLSPLAHPERDFVPCGTFPRRAEKTGLAVFVPSARYMLALKLKALRMSDVKKGSKDLSDVAGLLRLLDIHVPEDAVNVLAEFFPKSGSDADKQRFVVRHILSMETKTDAPSYPRRDG
jgi:hypothetical protein